MAFVGGRSPVFDGHLWAVSLLGALPDTIRDYGMSTRLLLAMVLVLRVMWVALHPPPLTETERQELRYHLPKVMESLWAAPSVSLVEARRDSPVRER
jgi:hypothetical protein